MFKPSVNGTYAWLTKLFKGTPPRHVVETLFLMRQPQACSVENGQNFVSATYCMKFNWFEFVCHEAGRDNAISIFSGASCELLLRANCLLYDIAMNQYPLGVLACVLYLRTAHVPPACTHEGPCPGSWSPHHVS